jgi:membrane protein YqaA with SNARE-associated domain
MTCYLIGSLGGKQLVIKLLSMKPEKLESWSKRAVGSEYLALLSWLPFIGELIAAALGIVSKRWLRIIVFMFIGKLLRYAFILKIGEYLFS